jgi:2-oxoglutarate ferredoxin oxidoreductase subunit delta
MAKAKAKPRGRVSFYYDSCKACGLCVHFCPRDILDFDEDTINPLGFHPVIVVKPEECTGCAICALMCPDLVIEVEKG